MLVILLCLVVALINVSLFDEGVAFDRPVNRLLPHRIPPCNLKDKQSSYVYYMINNMLRIDFITKGRKF